MCVARRSDPPASCALEVVPVFLSLTVFGLCFMCVRFVYLLCSAASSFTHAVHSFECEPPSCVRTGVKFVDTHNSETVIALFALCFFLFSQLRQRHVQRVGDVDHRPVVGAPANHQEEVSSEGDHDVHTGLA